MAGLLHLTFPAQYLALEAANSGSGTDLYERIGLSSPESFVRLCPSQSNRSTYRYIPEHWRTTVSCSSTSSPSSAATRSRVCVSRSRMGGWSSRGWWARWCSPPGSRSSPPPTHARAGSPATPPDDARAGGLRTADRLRRTRGLPGLGSRRAASSVGTGRGSHMRRGASTTMYDADLSWVRTTRPEWRSRSESRFHPRSIRVAVRNLGNPEEVVGSRFRRPLRVSAGGRYPRICLRTAGVRGSNPLTSTR